MPSEPDIYSDRRTLPPPPTWTRTPLTTRATDLAPPGIPLQGTSLSSEMSDAGGEYSVSLEEIPPSHGGYHRTHKIFLGGGKIGNDWLLKGQYRYSSQRREEKYIAKIEKALIDKRDSISDRKFHGTLDDTGDKELEKIQFVRALKQRVREHGHESFFAIVRGTSNTIVHDLLNDYHMFSVEDGIDSYEIRIADTTNPSVF
jgi:hypothetical protein